jgi:hypothetical protein
MDGSCSVLDVWFFRSIGRALVRARLWEIRPAGALVALHSMFLHFPKSEWCVVPSITRHASASCTYMPVSLEITARQCTSENACSWSFLNPSDAVSCEWILYTYIARMPVTWENTVRKCTSVFISVVWDRSRHRRGLGRFTIRSAVLTATPHTLPQHLCIRPHERSVVIPTPTLKHACSFSVVSSDTCSYMYETNCWLILADLFENCHRIFNSAIDSRCHSCSFLADVSLFHE